jgi:hypothetical protein
VIVFRVSEQVLFAYTGLTDLPLKWRRREFSVRWEPIFLRFHLYGICV